MPDSSVIDRAFSNNNQLKKRIFDAINSTPQHGPLFEDIARYHLSSQGDNDEQPASKKRKLANGSLPVVNSAPKNQTQTQTQTQQSRQVILEARDISFTLPQRKKLHLGIAQYGTNIDDPATSFTIFTRNPATSEVDMEIPLDQFAYALRLPVPEKAAKQYNFCLIPKSPSELSSAATATTATAEPIIWAVNHGPLKSCQISSSELAKIAPGSDSPEVLEAALDFVLNKSGGISLTYPTADEFASAKPESHRQADQAYHVKAFRGSKDGFLFFLHTGIFFGFKKPLAFFAFDDIESISYTSVLQRTFNLNIAYRQQPLNNNSDNITSSENNNDNLDGAGVIQEVEFSMLDQADFPGIDAYVKRHGLQDASLAESRRATKKANAATTAGTATTATTNGKHHGVNGSGQDGNGDDEQEEEEDTRTELEKAQQQLEDEEDEEEEDYDPGSDGDSDGSGGSDSEEEEEDDDDDDDGQYEREKKTSKAKARRNLVADELGSEAEDVSVSEDGDGDGEDAQDAAEEEDDQEETYDDDDDEEEEDEDEDEEKEHEEDAPPAPSIADKAASTHARGHQHSWGYEADMPDPDDEDQL